MTLDIRQTNAFLAVVQHGSLGRAAQALNVTQPALSRTVRRLEDQLGAPLFERYSTGMVLTAAGQALLPHASLLHHEAEQAREEINALRGLARGTIRVGTVAAVASLVLPRAIARVLEQWPNLQVYVVEGVGDLLADSLLSHDVDLVIGAWTPDLPAMPDVALVPDCGWEDTHHIVASTAHPLRRRSRLRLEDTLAQKWVLPPAGTAPYGEIKRLFAARSLALPDVAVETRSIITLKSLVAHAGFLSWMPGPMFDIERSAGVIDALPVAGTHHRRRLAVFRRAQGILPQPAVKLIDALRQVTARR